MGSGTGGGLHPGLAGLHAPTAPELVGLSTAWQSGALDIKQAPFAW